VILANLTAEIHMDLLPTVADHLAVGGWVVASGIVAERQLEVEAVARASGLDVREVRQEAEWRCLVLTAVSGER
jgi:ribosomal protein L11 methyltransferase